jgi:hypothetical protein
MKMTKLELFLILFPVEYLTGILILEMNKELTTPMDLGFANLVVGFIWLVEFES